MFRGASRHTACSSIEHIIAKLGIEERITCAIRHSNSPICTLELIDNLANTPIILTWHVNITFRGASRRTACSCIEHIFVG